MDAPTPDARLETESPEKAPKDQRPASSRLPSVIVGVVAVAVAGLSIWYLLRPQPLLVQGEVDATRLDIAARVDGRVAEIPVVRGQNVATGAVLVRIDNPETIAKNEQSLAAKIVTEAQLANINAGTRVEVIAARKATLERGTSIPTWIALASAPAVLMSQVAISANPAPPWAKPAWRRAFRNNLRHGRGGSRMPSRRRQASL
jgi:multidrug efflux pump subunit AcrA (membrane-fusion protein)